MPFVDGYATEEDIKLPLYTIEPEQLSDLVAVPDPKEELWNIQPITRNVVPVTRAEKDVQDVSFPLSQYPCLFQRFNPYGENFADGYSTKLYNWRRKYSKFFLQQINNYFLKVSRPINENPIQVSFDIGNELEITLPDIGKKIDISYYYPELNPNEFTMSRSFSDFTVVDSETVGEWRTITTPRGNEPLARGEAYKFRRIQNDCIYAPVTRSWLIRFGTHFCQGQKIKIDEDILISSLVLTTYDFNEEELNLIKDQIPDCYFYEYLDTFFSTLDLAILQSNPNLLNWQIATEVDFEVDFNYEIQHRHNGKETIEDVKNFYYKNFYVNRASRLKYSLDDNDKYIIKANSSNKPNLKFKNYVPVPEIHEIGTIIYANNNNWDNYQFNLNDRGTVHLQLDVFNNNGKEEKVIRFGYLGNFDDRGFSNEPENLTIFGIPHQLNQGLTDTFFSDGFNTNRRWGVQALVCERELWKEADKVYNNYFARLLYDSASNVPNFTINVGNDIEESLEIVSNPDADKPNQEPKLIRNTSKKKFRTGVDIEYIDCNFKDIRQDRISPSKDSRYESERNVIGEIVYTFGKWGQSHPTSQQFYVEGDDYGYRPNKYYPGIPYSGASESSELIFHETEPVYEGAIINGKSQVRYFLNRSLLNTNKYYFIEDTNFNIVDSFSKTYTATLNLASSPKFYRKYDFELEAKEFITKAHEECYMANCDLEELKKQVLEIHTALGAAKFAYRENTEDQARDWNLGEQIQAQSDVLGLCFNSDYSIRSIRQGKVLEQGQPIPAGWSIGQFGKNTGGSSSGQTGGAASEKRFGIAHQIKTNQFVVDEFTGERTAIEQGGYVLAENIPQYLHFVFQDLDRAFGWQDMGANALPSPNGNELATYTGLNSMMLDSLYTLGQLSRQISSINVLSMKGQAMTQEIMSAFGLPITIKELQITANGGIVGVLPFPGFAVNSPTLQDLHSLTNLNIGALIGGKLEIIDPDAEEEEDTEKEEDTE